MLVLIFKVKEFALASLKLPLGTSHSVCSGLLVVCLNPSGLWLLWISWCHLQRSWLCFLCVVSRSFMRWQKLPWMMPLFMLV